MKSIQIIEPDILQNINEEKSRWKAIKNRKSRQIYNKETLFQKSFNIKEDDFPVFQEYLEEYKMINHKCLNPLKYVILPNKEQMKNGTLCTEYQITNLKDVINNFHKEKNKLNEAQKFIIIYGTAKFMEFLEGKNKFHGRLNVSNIFLKNEFWPIITDPLLHHFFQKYEDDKKSLSFESLICYPSEYYLNNIRNIKTDVYSFGIIMIQLFTEQVEITNVDNKFAEKILNGEKLTFEFNLPEDISNLIIQCLEENPESRPDFKNIVETLEKIYENNKAFNSDHFEEYKKYLNEPEKIKIITENNNQIRQFKEDADKGEPLAMYLYGKAKYEGDKCIMDKEIGIKYLSAAAILKNKEAINFFEVIELEQKLLNKNKDNSSEDYSDSFNDSQKDLGKNLEKMGDRDLNKIKSLYEDKFFNQEQNEEEISKIIESVHNNYMKNYDDEIIEKIKAKVNEFPNFIFTPPAMDRLCKLYNYLSTGVAVLLEGPTGTSKSLSVEIICKLLNKKLIRFNLSSETTVPDLMGRYIGDKNSWGGITLKEGPYKTAAENGYVLLLDEINLASERVLQSIEASIDSKVISVEIPGMPLKEIEINENFCLVATQNPNKGLFANKRQNLSQKFLNKFQPIYFPTFSKSEFLQIAQGLSKNFGYKGNQKLIEDLIDFHYKWSMKPELSNDVQCLTIREIAATIDAFSKGENPFDTVLTIYGARYGKKRKEELIKTLNGYMSFKAYTSQKYSLPNTFPKCFVNKALLDVMKSVEFSFKNRRNVILSGKEGSGLTQIAKWISKWYELEKNESKSSDSYFCMVTEETKNSDLIGKLVPVQNPKAGQELIDWNSAFLLKAIKLGKCAVLDGIDNARSIVTERLNGLLDETYGKGDKLFDVPENPKKPQVLIHANFRLLCTAKINKINQMSPAFVNRFDIIVLEDQLENISEKEFSDLVKLLMNQPNIFPQENELEDEEKEEKEEKRNKILKELEKKKEIIYDNDEELSDNEEEINKNKPKNTDQKNAKKKYDFDDDEEDEADEEKEEKENKKEEKKDDNKEDNKENKKKEIKINKYNIDDDEDEEELKDQEKEEDKIKNNEKEKKDEEILYDPSPKLIELIANKLGKNKNIYLLSKLCRAIVIFMKEIGLSDGITESSIVDLSYQVISNEESINLSQEIQNVLISKLEKEPVNYQGDNYFFEKSPILKNFMAFLVACSLINQHVCVTGPAGAGKTSGARKFSFLRKHKSKMAYQMHSFHAGTKPNHFYGTTSLEDGKINYINGTLTNSLIKGCIFIADELNLSPATTMKSLAPALELYFNEPIYFPGITEPIKIKSSFFFIACQNDLSTIGRNMIPNTIASKFRYIPYPKQSEKDITDICKEIKNKIFWNNDSQITDKDAENIGKFMLSYNESSIRALKPWSLRDITKLMNRIKYQEKHPDDFKKIDPYLNVLFYCLSSLNKEDKKVVENVSEKIFELIIKCFKIEEPEKIKRMKNCFRDKAVIQRDSLSGKSYIMKNDCGVSFKNFEKKLNQGSELYSILESIFLISLSSEDEPIIIFGPSGYKTYLSKLFLSQPKVISLNPESTISQLLGSSAFLVESEAKAFYLDYLCKLCGGKKRKDIYIELNNKLMNGTLDKYDVQKLTENFKEPECFDYAVKNLSKKLLSNSLIENCALSDVSLEFRPGLIFSSIIEGCPLILKNLPNLPTIVLERFNELLATQHSLTVNEDIHNTFTDKNDKELSNFSNKFRIFGTCQTNELNKLSDAVLSRCSPIYVSAYSINEQETALKNFIENNNIKFSENNIKYLVDILSSISGDKSFSFIQVINCIEICSRLNNRCINLTDSEEKYNLGITLYKILNGGLERILSINKRKKKQGELFGKVFKDSKSQEEIHEVNPFSFEEEKGKKKLISKITHLELESPSCKINPKMEKRLAFVDYFIDMLDVLHFGFCCHVPIILEGKPGQGKQTAINFIADTLGYDIINIMLSSTTKVDDLLGREKISKENNKIKIKFKKTKFSNALTHKEEKDGRKQIIVLHNLNKCTPAVLEALLSIFDLHEPKILYKNGEVENVKESYIIGIYNGDNGKNKLPHALVSSSIYHIVPNPYESDIKNIIHIKFNLANLKSDIDIFQNNFNKTKKIALEHNSSFPLSLNDIEKYIEFRKVSKEFFDEQIISQIIFAYRFIEPDITKEVLRAINLSELKFVPSFNYSLDKKYLFVKISENSNKELVMQTHNQNIDVNEIKSILNGLTDTETRCLFFLILCYKTKIIPIIQGETASGKSFIIRLFSKMLGQKLNVYQMNQDTGLSIFSGQSILSSTLTKEDEISFKKVFSGFEDIPKVKEYFVKNFENVNVEKWSPQQFADLLEIINNYIKENKFIDTLKMNLLKDGQKKIKEICLPANRFLPAKSMVIKSLEKGEWVFFDGMESAPEEISEKCSSLNGKYGKLDLYDLGVDNSYVRHKKKDANLPEEKEIDNNFFLIVSYNPTTQSETKILDPSFMNKGITFTLSPMDYDNSSRSKIISGALLSSNYKNLISYQFALRISNVHQFIKEISEKNRETFAGDLKFTGRNLLFICKQFYKYQKSNESLNNLQIPIIKALNNFYSNSLNTDRDDEKLKFKKNMIDKFTDNIKAEDYLNFSSQTIDKRETYKPLLLILKNIQISIMDKKDYDFSFKKFIDYLGLVKLQDIEFINNYIEQTMFDFIFINKNTMNKYYLLLIANKIMKKIISNLSYVKDQQKMNNLLSLELLKIDNLNPILTKFHFLSKIVSDSGDFFSLTAPTSLVNNGICNILQLISNLVENKNLDNLSKIISLMHSDKDNIKIIDTFFPYYKFANKIETKLICHFLPLIVKLNEENNNFKIIINDSNYEFSYNDNKEFVPTFSFNIYNKLLLGVGTRLQFGDINKLSPKELKKSFIEFSPDSETNEDLYRDSLMFCHLTERCVEEKIKQRKGLKKYLDNFDDDFKIIDSKLRAEKIYLNNFYLNDNGAMISKLWNLIYFINDKNLLNNLKTILNDVESKILSVVENLLEEIDFNEIELYVNFTRKMVNFCNRNSMLWKIIFKINLFEKDETKEEALEIKQKILDEKEYILSILPLKNIWTNEEYVKKLGSGLNYIEKKLYELEEEKEKSIIKSKISDLIQKLNKANYPEESMRKTKESMVENLNNIELTEENLINCESIVSNFLNSLNISQQEMKEIIWPLYDPTLKNNYKNDETYSKFFSCLIWYSEMSYLLENYVNNNNINSNIIFDKFNKNGLGIISNFLINKKTNLKQVTAKETEKLFSMIKMTFLNKLIENNCYEKIIAMKKIFNDIKERNFLSEEDYKWIFELSTKYPINFQIKFPLFDNPNDLIYLFLSITEKPSFYKEGPMKIGEKDNELIDELVENFGNNSYEECANKIAKAIYHVYISKTEKLFNDNNELKLYFDDKINEFEGKIEKNEAVKIIKKCKFVLEMGGDLSRKEETVLDFDDLEFLTSKIWEFGDEITKKYPSLIYWLIKNEKSYFEIIKDEKLLEWYNKVKKNEKIEYIPFFVLCLRLMSSYNCLNFELINQKGTIYQKKKQQFITNEVIKSITKRNKENMKIKWFNIMLKSVPSYIFDENYRFFYNYLNYLTEDVKYNLTSFQQKIKDEMVDSIIKKIIKIVMEEEVDDEIKKIFEIDNKNNEVYYLFDPAEIIFQKILSSKNEELSKFKNDPEFLKIGNQIGALIEEEIPNNITNLMNGMSEDINKFEEISQTEYEKDKANSLNNINEKIEKYNQYLHSIINDIRIDENFTFNDYVATIKEYLTEMNLILKDKVNEKLYESLYDKNDSIDIFYSDYSGKSQDIYKIFLKSESKLIYESKGTGKKEIIFPKNIFELKIEPDDKSMPPLLIINEEFTKMYYKLDGNKLNKEEFFKANKIEKASLHINFEFENNNIMSEQKTIEYLNDYLNEVKKNLNIVEFIQNNKFDDCSKNLDLNINKLKKFNPKIIYTQENTGNKAEYALNSLIDSFANLKKYIQELKELFKRPDEICKETKSLTESQYLFSNILKIKIPTIFTKYKEVGFKNIKNYNSLVSPIISADEQSKKLVCSLNEINTNFKPIIGALYNDSNYSISLITSVNEKLNLQIEFAQNFYKRYFSNKITNESIEIKIKIPENNDKEEKDISIKGNIKVISKNYSELNIPYNLSIQILPLQILFYCDEYLIAFKNENYYLCAEKIIANTTLHFCAKYYNSKENVIQKINLISLEDNKAQIPQLNNDNSEKIELKILGSNKPIRLQCLVNFAFSKKIIIPLNIDAIINPFDYAFEVYDFSVQKYKNSTEVIFSEKNKELDFDPVILKFRVYLPNLYDNKTFTGKISLSPIRDFIEILNLDEIKDKEFEIKDKYEFFIKIKLNKKKAYFSTKLNVYVSINNSPKQEIQIKFTHYILGFKNNTFRYNIHDDICYNSFDFLNLTEQNYNIYKNINNIYQDRNCIFGLSGIDFYSKRSSNYGWRKSFSNFEQFLADNGYSNSATFIIMYYDLKEDFWVPFPEQYPKELDKLKKVKITDNSKEILEKENKDKINFFDSFREKHYDRKDFGYLIKKLIFDEDLRKNLKYLINLFPNKIQFNLNKELEDIKKNYIWVYYYNFIIELFNIFRDRYNLLKNISKSNEQIKKIVVEKNKQYYTIKNIITNEINENKIRLNDLEENYNKMKIKNQLKNIENKYEVMLLTEKSFEEKKAPEMKSKKDKPIYKEFKDEEEENDMKNMNNEKNTGMSIKDLENIEIPKEISIYNLSKFYSNCIQNSKILPLVVRDIFLSEKKNQSDFDTIEDIYMKLKNLYHTFKYEPGRKIKDSSILSMKINQFIDSFESMVMKFKNSDNKLNLGLMMNLDMNKKTSDFIREPELDDFTLPGNEWKTEKKRLYQNNLLLTDNIIENSLNQRDNYRKKIEEENRRKREAEKYGQISQKDLEKKLDKIEKIEEEINLDIVKKLGDSQKFDNYKSDDENKEFDYFKPPIDEEEKEELELKKKKDKKDNNNKRQQLNKQNIMKNFENLLKNFNEKEGIERTTRRLEELNDDQSLNIQYKKTQMLDPNLLINDNWNFTAKDLFMNSLFITSYIIKESSEYEIPFENIYANVLIDCSRYINDLNKMYNLVAIFGLVEGLNELKIPYSVTVISDENFRTVIKQFDEEHSNKVIQRIRDCAMVPRFKSNYASNLKFAIDNLNYNSSKRNQRAFFLFSDGLNENLKLTKSWAKLILNKENDSFGFIFIKSHDLIKPEIWENVWNNFDEKVKEAGALSYTKLFLYEDNDLFFDNNLTNLAKGICSVLDRKIESQINTGSQNILKHCFNLEDEYNELNENNLNSFYENCEKQNYGKLKEIYLKINNDKDITQNIHKGGDESINRDNFGKILNCPIRNEQIKTKLKELIKVYYKSKQKINLISLESIYKPNKASQYVLSSTGTDFEITALILNLINPVPEPLIYLEEKGGLMRNYRVTIILDTSISCLNNLSFLHTFQTLNYLLCSCSCLDLPCFDFIVARDTNPILICSEIGTLNALNEKSDFWPTLFTILNNPVINCNLSSAIKLGYDLRRIRSIEKGSFLYVLTDGLYQDNERKEILKSINDCEQNGINVIGIGLGIYPKGIEKLFTNSLYCRDPSTLIKGISYFFGEEISFINSMPDLLLEPTDSNEMNNIIKKLKDAEPDFLSLKNYLQNLTPELDAVQDLFNFEQDVGDEKRGFHNIEEGKNTQIYVKDSLKGQKILIVMLYEEGSYITVKRIFESGGDSSKCIKDAADHFGISIIAVTNYNDAIKEIKKQSKPGYCDYYAVWVTSSSGSSALQPSDPTGALNFVKTLEKFWKNGGSLVLFVDNAPYTYEVNLFLKEATFPNGTKINFTIDGNHHGTKILTADPSGNLNNNQTFNRSPLLFKECQRSSLAHNLGKIYEGVTIAFCTNVSQMKPFNAFAKDSDGGITIMYYCADNKAGTGDIILDGGYTKLFINMTEEGTYKYIQNIIGWTARPEVHYIIDKEAPTEWRPKAVV